MKSIAEILAKKVPGVGTSSPMSAEEFADLRAKWANEEIGSLTGFDCQDCRNKGYTMKRRGTELVSVECHCMAMRRSIRNMEKSGLMDLLDRYTFDRYQTPDKLYRDAKQKALDYLTDYERKWFVASGNPGSGKTHLCTAMCGELLKTGLEVRYMLWRDSAVQIKAAVNDPEAYDRLVDPLKRVPVLYIDDFFKAAKITPGDINLAFELLNTRYNTKRLITIISSELSIEQILDIDEAVGSRIYERSKGYYLRFDGAGINWRLK